MKAIIIICIIYLALWADKLYADKKESKNKPTRDDWRNYYRK